MLATEDAVPPSPSFSTGRYGSIMRPPLTSDEELESESESDRERSRIRTAFKHFQERVQLDRIRQSRRRGSSRGEFSDQLLLLSPRSSNTLGSQASFCPASSCCSRAYQWLEDRGTQLRKFLQSALFLNPLKISEADLRNWRNDDDM